MAARNSSRIHRLCIAVICNVNHKTKFTSWALVQPLRVTSWDAFGAYQGVEEYLEGFHIDIGEGNDSDAVERRECILLKCFTMRICCSWLGGAVPPKVWLTGQLHQRRGCPRLLHLHLLSGWRHRRAAHQLRNHVITRPLNRNQVSSHHRNQGNKQAL